MKSWLKLKKSRSKFRFQPQPRSVSHPSAAFSRKHDRTTITSSAFRGCLLIFPKTSFRHLVRKSARNLEGWPQVKSISVTKMRTFQSTESRKNQPSKKLRMIRCAFKVDCKASVCPLTQAMVWFWWRLNVAARVHRTRKEAVCKQCSKDSILLSRFMWCRTTKRVKVFLKVWATWMNHFQTIRFSRRKS